MGHKGRPYQKKVVVRKVENEIRLCLCHGKYSVWVETYEKGREVHRRGKVNLGRYPGPD